MFDNLKYLFYFTKSIWKMHWTENDNEQGFCPFLRQIFAIIQSFAAPYSVRSNLKNHQIRQKIGKKMKKILVQVALNFKARVGTRPRNQPKNRFEASWTKLFFIFCPIFCHIWRFFRVKWTVLKAQRNPFLHGTSKTHEYD